jgi:outer membrane protein OmpA-like peptidoglycan-associated protein
MKPIPIVHFPYGSAIVPADAEPMLRDVVETMRAHPEITLVAVEGHTDVEEGRWIKGDVSRRRADAVRDQLVAKGIEPGRLTVVAHGSTKPLDDNATAAGRARNRRVQFRVEETKRP